jgi:hypothetical protein
LKPAPPIKAFSPSSGEERGKTISHLPKALFHGEGRREAMNPIITCIGLFFSAEGAGNLLYWWTDNHPWYFQVGRFVRVVLGLILIIIGVSGSL